jgi:hypothetical protein
MNDYGNMVRRLMASSGGQPQQAGGSELARPMLHPSEEPITPVEQRIMDVTGMSLLELRINRAIGKGQAMTGSQSWK